jgi:GR25 family glycosyltransferase involved in LPS biosynthesis
MSWSFDNIPKYVINLDRRTDRWKSFQEVSGFKELNNLRRWSGTDGKNLNIDTDNRISLYTKFNLLRSARRSHMELETAGGVGCYISHVEVWKHFLEKEKSEVGMIMEDDSIMDKKTISGIKTFIQKSKVMNNTELWDFSILAPHTKNINHGPMYHYDTTCIRLIEFTGLTAYLFTKKGISKILPYVYPIQMHIDWFLSVSAQFQIINICTPQISLVRVRDSITDVAKYYKNTYKRCDVCDIESDYLKTNTIVSRTTLIKYQIEEIVLILGALFAIGVYAKKL